jgi:hypothetical protein
MNDSTFKFQKEESMETGLDRENAQEFIFTHNQNNIFALVHDLGEMNEIITRKLLIFTVPE